MSRMSIPRDVQEFLDGYPDNEDDDSLSDNFAFYSNRLRCRPDNRSIEEIHDQWFGEHDKLEYKHGYIQWLFPIQEYGMNYASQPLQQHEIASMKADPTILKRIVLSYELMLDFYGMRLLDENTGLLDRVQPPRNYTARYMNLIRAMHNNLRITRILKCLSEFGMEHIGIAFLLFVLSEQSESDELNTPGLRGSMDRWWANCIRNDDDRQWVGDLIRQVRTGTVTFTREKYKAALAERSPSNRS